MWKAKKRESQFELTLDQFETLIQRGCIFCGEQNEPRGIDRKNNRQGYLLDNCESCCWPCNKFKGIKDEYEFLSVALKIARHQEALQKQKPKTLVPVLTPEPTVEAAVPSPQPVKLLVAPSVDPTLDPQARRFLDTGRF